MQNQIETSHATAEQGLVISYFGNSVAVEGADGQVFQCHLRRNQILPVVGDEVRWQREGSDAGIIVEVCPRRSLLSRGTRNGKSQPLAANIDFIMIMMAPPPIFSEYLVDRYIVAAELLNIQPVIIINKADLLDAQTEQAVRDRLAPYQQMQYPTFLLSVWKKTGLSALSDFLCNKSAVFVGPSGVGKSSVITALTNQVVRTSEVSVKGIGKHTTTATRLYRLPTGGYVIDSPGVREFNLWPISKQDLLKSFKEFASFASRCRFRDCLHLKEPDCAVQEAVESDKMSAQRLANYHTLINELCKNDKSETQ
ncbi:MAG TPA: ribosome small subunit-dependent GTPase A [Gammaproteobacteria bacterium]|jgi:ribosome biogenesis GTPase|nr:ribosome small subunit-dependent GTPase A [Gammaproteobacteria bacterium]